MEAEIGAQARAGGEGPSAPAGAAAPPTLAARVVAWDLALMKRLAALTVPKAVNAPLIFLVRIGDGWIWCLVALYLWRFLPMTQFKPVVLNCILAVAISLAFYWPVKLLVKRPRPFVLYPGVTAKVPPLDKYSFPSGHTMNNLAVSLTLSLYLPHLFLPALLIPLLLGGLRMLFGVHFLSDITGGAVLGIASFLLAWWIFPLLPF